MVADDGRRPAVRLGAGVGGIADPPVRFAGGQVECVGVAAVVRDVGRAVGEPVDARRGDRGGGADVSLGDVLCLVGPDLPPGDRVDGVDGRVGIVGAEEDEALAGRVDGIRVGIPRAVAGRVVGGELPVGRTRRGVDRIDRCVRFDAVHPEVDRLGSAGRRGDRRGHVGEGREWCRLAEDGARRRIELVQDGGEGPVDPDVTVGHQWGGDDGRPEVPGPEDRAGRGVEGGEAAVDVPLVDDVLTELGVVLDDRRRLGLRLVRDHPLDPQTGGVRRGDGRVGGRAGVGGVVAVLRPGVVDGRGVCDRAGGTDQERGPHQGAHHDQ